MNLILLSKLNNHIKSKTFSNTVWICADKITRTTTLQLFIACACTHVRVGGKS